LLIVLLLHSAEAAHGGAEAGALAARLTTGLLSAGLLSWGGLAGPRLSRGERVIPEACHRFSLYRLED
jgi:hypothetical protein